MHGCEIFFQMVSGSPSSGEEVFRRLLAGDDDDDEEEPSVVPGDDNGGSSGTPNLQNISSPLDIISSLLGFPQNRPPARNRQNFSLLSDGEGESSGPVQNLMNLFGTPVNSGNAGSAVQSAPRSSSNVQRGLRLTLFHSVPFFFFIFFDNLFFLFFYVFHFLFLCSESIKFFDRVAEIDIYLFIFLVSIDFA